MNVSGVWWIFKNLFILTGIISAQESHFLDLISTVTVNIMNVQLDIYISVQPKRGFLNNNKKSFHWFWDAVDMDRVQHCHVEAVAWRWERTTICCIYPKLIFCTHTHTDVLLLLAWFTFPVCAFSERFTNSCCYSLCPSLTYFLDLYML